MLFSYGSINANSLTLYNQSDIAPPHRNRQVCIRDPALTFSPLFPATITISGNTTSLTMGYESNLITLATGYDPLRLLGYHFTAVFSTFTERIG